MKPKQMVKVLYQGKMVETYSDISVMEGVVVIDNGNIAKATEIVGSATSDVTAANEIAGVSDTIIGTVELPDGTYSDVYPWDGAVVESEWDSELIVTYPKITTLQSIVQALRNFLTALGEKFKWTS